MRKGWKKQKEEEDKSKYNPFFQPIQVRKFAHSAYADGKSYLIIVVVLGCLEIFPGWKFKFFLVRFAAIWRRQFSYPNQGDQ